MKLIGGMLVFFMVHSYIALLFVGYCMAYAKWYLKLMMNGLLMWSFWLCIVIIQSKWILYIDLLFLVIQFMQITPISLMHLRKCVLFCNNCLLITPTSIIIIQNDYICVCAQTV